MFWCKFVKGGELFTKFVKTILFTGGGGAGNVEIWNNLKKKHSLYFADCNVSAIHPDIPLKRRILIKNAKTLNI